LLAFVLPLGVDSFAIAATLGAAAVSAKQRWRITGLFVLFEAGMPLLGLAIGAPLARAVGGVADYLAAAALVAVGLWMLFGGDEDTEQDKARRLLDARGFVMVGWGWVSASTSWRSGSASAWRTCRWRRWWRRSRCRRSSPSRSVWRWVRASVSGGARPPNASPRSP
jgi:hypothetical protein